MFPKCHETVPRYIAKVVKKVKLQMKSHHFHFKEPVFITGSSSSFNLACDSNIEHLRVAMRLLPHYIYEMLENFFNSVVCDENTTTLRTDSVRNNKFRLQKRLYSCPEMVKFLL